MKNLRLSDLIKINEDFLYHHKEITESDIQKINELKRRIELNLEAKAPASGDCVILKGYNNYERKEVIYENGHIENSRFNYSNFSACTRPYVPFVFEKGMHGFTLDTSGGVWSEIPKTDLIPTGKIKEKLFKTFGHVGVCGAGGIYFPASVRVWEYENADKIY